MESEKTISREQSMNRTTTMIRVKKEDAATIDRIIARTGRGMTRADVVGFLMDKYAKAIRGDIVSEAGGLVTVHV